MKIEITKIEKASLLFEKIKNIYAEISKVESLATFASCNDFKGKFKLTLTDSESLFNPKDDEILKHISDFMPPPNHWMAIDPVQKFPFNPRASLFEKILLDKPKNNDSSNTLSDQLSENATMQILGIILCEKQKQLKLLIDELKEIQNFFIQMK